jgi:hypothetical protein
LILLLSLPQLEHLVAFWLFGIPQFFKKHSLKLRDLLLSLNLSQYI